MGYSRIATLTQFPGSADKPLNQLPTTIYTKRIYLYVFIYAYIANQIHMEQSWGAVIKHFNLSKEGAFK